MKDFLVVEQGHTFIMRNKSVIRQIGYFLEHGEFDHSMKSSEDDIVNYSNSVK